MVMVEWFEHNDVQVSSRRSIKDDVGFGIQKYILFNHIILTYDSTLESSNERVKFIFAHTLLFIYIHPLVQDLQLAIITYLSLESDPPFSPSSFMYPEPRGKYLLLWIWPDSASLRLPRL